MRTVIFANQGIGDLVMAFPLLQALSAHESDRLLVITQANYHRAVVELAFLPSDERAEVVGLRDLGRGSLSRAWSLLRTVRRFGPDAVIVPYGVDHVRGAVVSWLSGARIRVGPAAGPLRRLFTHYLSGDMSASPGFHKVEEGKRAARILGREPPRALQARRTLGSLDSIAAPFDGFPGGVIAVALGSGPRETHKRLTAPLATQLVVGLLNQFPECSVVLLGNDAERRLNGDLMQAMDGGGRLFDLTGQTSFPELLGILARSRVLVATCNGISHLAALTPCPIVGLFGPTDPGLTGPFGSNLTAIRRGLACSPCYTRSFWKGCGNPVCMDLSTLDILKAVRSYVAPRALGTTPMSESE